MTLILAGHGAALSAATELEAELESGAAITIERHTGTGRQLLLWLPSEHGTRPPQTDIAERLAALGIEVWIADLHSAYFIPVGRSSMDQFPVADIVELIDKAHTLSGKRVFVAATGRGAQLALRAIRAHQMDRTDTAEVLGGAVLFHPYLYGGRPHPGEDPPLLPIARATNLPVFLLQPTLSAKHWRTASLVEALSEGGSPVFTQALQDTTDGFHLRTDDDLSEADLAARGALPATLQRALTLLSRLPVPQQAATLPSTDDTPPSSSSPALGLTPLNGAAPTLALPDRRNTPQRLDSLRGKVVLVSFWASWCPPCVEEIPSLNMLNDRLTGRPFQILSVNVGETDETIAEFVRQHPVDFPILRDPSGTSVAPWKVYAYPTNYLIDASGKLRYGRFGAMDWTSPSVLETIESLIHETEG